MLEVVSSQMFGATLDWRGEGDPERRVGVQEKPWTLVIDY